MQSPPETSNEQGETSLLDTGSSELASTVERYDQQEFEDRQRALDHNLERFLKNWVYPCVISLLVGALLIAFCVLLFYYIRGVLGDTNAIRVLLARIFDIVLISGFTLAIDRFFIRRR